MKKFLSLIFLISALMGGARVQAVDSSSSSNLEIFPEKLSLKQKKQVQEGQEILQREFAAPEVIAQEEDTESIQKIMKRLRIAFNKIGPSLGSYLLFPYLEKAASLGKFKVVDYILNYDMDTQYDPLGSFFDKKALASLMENVEVQGYEKVMDLLAIFHAEERLYENGYSNTQFCDTRPLSPDLIESWKRILSNEQAHMAPYTTAKLLSDIVLGYASLKPLADIMLKNYVENRSNVPAEEVIQWLIPDPKGEEHGAMYTPLFDGETKNEIVQRCFKASPSMLHTRYDDNHEDVENIQTANLKYWKNRVNYMLDFVKEKSLTEKEDGLYYRVLQKLYDL